MHRNNRRKPKFLKIITIMFGIIAVFSLTFVIYFFAVTAGTTLNVNKLAKATSNTIKICSIDGKEIVSKTSSSSSTININELPSYTKHAFIAMEDKAFYKHFGINPKRIVGALINNIKSGKTKEGASTITQQLVKNTFLSNEKTLDRKMKEIKLAFQVENRYSKDEILEMYLNTIYFGNNCYGIEDASLFYFDKHASNLTLNESATLVAIINAPAIYNPLTNINACRNRRDLVLDNMFNDGYITSEELANTKLLPIEVSAKNRTNPYCLQALKEACDILGETENTILNKNLTITTFLNQDLQNLLQSNLQDKTLTPAQNALSIVIDNDSGAVISFASNLKDANINIKRSPGSIIKPILVYSPAIDSGLINPATLILDEEINYDGYSPHNPDKTYHGYISVRESIKKSLNIPAVKILDMVGIDKAKRFASNLNITFDNEDNSLSLALGAMKNGLTIKEVADAYSCFASGGAFCDNKFIKEIKNVNGDIIYSYQPHKEQRIQKDTAFLINNMLLDVSQSGTAVRLSDLPFLVASKTGTVGIKGSTNNTDAWSVSYNPSHTVLTWLGAQDTNNGFNASINGSTYPTMINKETLKYLYHNIYPKTFSQPNTIKKLYYDLNEYETNKIVKIASKDTPERFKMTEFFSIRYIPESASTNNSTLNQTFDSLNIIILDDKLKKLFNFSAIKKPRC